MRLLRFALLVLALLAPVAQIGQAQTTGGSSVRAALPQDSGVDYRTWEGVANRAEAAVEARTDDVRNFEALRTRVAEFRSQFDTARNADADRIATLRSQIEALGPAPAEDGPPEAADVAARRVELNDQLAALLAPVKVAQEAYTRADGLIGEIDQIIRDRQTQRLLALDPSPLNPVLWPTALRELAAAFSTVWTEQQIHTDAGLSRNTREQLPRSLLVGLVGLVLLFRGRSWSTRFGNKMRKIGGRGSGVWGFVISLGRIVVPLAGLMALTGALVSTGMLGPKVEQFMLALPVWGGAILGFRWLAERLFSRNDDEALLNLPAQRRTEARYYATILALLVVLRGVLETIVDLSNISSQSHAVLAFPLMLLTGLILFRLGQILYGNARKPAEDEDDEPEVLGSTVDRIIRWLGLAVMAVAIAGPVMAGVGFRSAGDALLYPTVLSLALLGLVMILQRLASDLYGWITGKGAEARDSLIPILINFVLLLLSTPVLALIWGARVADLTELWAAFLGGFSLGDTRISPTDFLKVVVIFAAGYLITRVLQSALKTSVLPKTRIDPGGQTAIVSGVGYVGIFLAAIAAITGAGINLSSLAFVAGALSVGIGFGLQNIVSNFVSGIILLIERPISEGDWIEVGGQHGYVRDISVRSTRIETFDRSDVIVPNADLVSGTVTNYTRGNTVGRLILPVGVAYGTETRKVAAILQEIAEKHPMVLLRPPPSVVFVGFGASSLDFEIRAILRDVNWILSVKTEMNHQIAERFTEEGIEIPFAQTDIWLRNPEALRPREVPDVRHAEHGDEVGTIDPDDAEGEGDGDTA